MKRILTFLLLCAMLPALPAHAVESKEATFESELSCALDDAQGGHKIEIGDVVTFQVALRRTDLAEEYPMFYYQTEVYFETAYFELVKDSISIDKGAVGFQRGYRDGLNGKTAARVQMNYVDFSGRGVSHPSEIAVGTFQLKAIRSGTTTVAQQHVKIGTMEAGREGIISTADCGVFTIADARGNVDTSRPSSGGETEKKLALTSTQSGKTQVSQAMLRGVSELRVKNAPLELVFSSDAVKALHALKADITITLKKGEKQTLLPRTAAQIGQDEAFTLQVSTAEGQAKLDLSGITVLAAPDSTGRQPTLYRVVEDGALAYCAEQSQDKSGTTVAFANGEQLVVKYIGHAFADVSGWYACYVDTLFDAGIMQGINEVSFAPGRQMTRAEAVATLARMSGESLPKAAAQFEDVKETDWFSPYVAWAQESGVAQGVSKTRFDPNGLITREQFAVMLMRFSTRKGFSLVDTQSAIAFSDADQIASYAKNAVDQLVRADIISGRPDGTFNPAGKLTRSECAKILAIFAQSIK